ncbi:hypothetical protein [Natrinema soli]|uniref:Uncharacterized protein n=1 Tax=Natrinema soli TaxID=1930624 RepID=A0ABD5SPE3_9EURY
MGERTTIGRIIPHPDARDSHARVELLSKKSKRAVSQAATHGYLGATAAKLPSDHAPEPHRTVDETVEQLKSTHAEL